MIKIFKEERFDRLPDAILFDTDNTLYPYNPAHAAARRAVQDKVVSTFSIAVEDFTDNAEMVGESVVS